MEQDSEQDKPVFTVVYVSSLKVKECWEHQPALQTEGLILPEDMLSEQDCMTDAKIFWLKPILMQDIIFMENQQINLRNMIMHNQWYQRLMLI